MDPDIRNFSKIENHIRENPREADAQAFEWQQFLRANAGSSPELFSMETPEEFYRWAQEHPGIDTSVWVGKEISDSYYYLREQHENNQMQANGQIDTSDVPLGLIVLPILAAGFLKRPKIIQDDNDYKKIEERLKKEWLEKNQRKDFSSKERLDYLYGSPEDPARQSLAKEAEVSFRNNPKFKKRVGRYDREKKKVYKNPKDDPSLNVHESITESHVNARLKYLKTHDSEMTSEETVGLVRKRSLEDFAVKFPEKAKAYGQKIQGLQSTQEKIQINEALAAHTAESGKEIKYVEKKHISSPSISVSDATKILREVSRPQGDQPYTISTSTPALARGQVAQSLSGRLPRGGINRGPKSAINGLADRLFKNSPGGAAMKAGRLAAQLGARVGAFLFTNPAGWVILAIIIVLVITFVIVFSLGAPPTETGVNAAQITSPTVVPTEVITPTPEPESAL